MKRRICSKCHKDKALTVFPKHVTGVDGRLRHCKDCLRAINRALYSADPEKYATARRRRKLKRNYGITEAQYEEMLVAQGGVCAICFRPETVTDPRTGKARRLAVDHDHISKRVRGLLCYRCNTTIGAFEDDVTLHYSAIAYHKRFRETMGDGTK